MQAADVPGGGAGGPGFLPTILIVDDSEINRRVAESHLVAEGYPVVLAASGKEALDGFREVAPALLLLDVVMPGLDGFEVCRRIRALPGGSDVSIVFLTSLTERDAHRRAMDAGADDFLNKPIRRAELLMRVRSLLWVKSLKGELRRGYELISSQESALRLAQERWRELVSFAVHDLKNPVAAVLMSAAYVEGKAKLAPDEREALGDILLCARRMQRLVANLLDINRAEDGVLVPRWAAIDAERLLGAVVDENRWRAQANTQALELQSEIGGRKVQVDPDLFSRLVENLVDNALKYSPDHTTIRVVARIEDDGTLDVAVHDQGSGVPRELRDVIFEKYARAAGEASPIDAQSHGLGLTFSRLAAEALGGCLLVEEEQPRGSCFRVRIPPRAAGSSEDAGSREAGLLMPLPATIRAAPLRESSAESSGELPRISETEDADGAATARARSKDPWGSVSAAWLGRRAMPRG